MLLYELLALIHIIHYFYLVHQPLLNHLHCHRMARVMTILSMIYSCLWLNIMVSPDPSQEHHHPLATIQARLLLLIFQHLLEIFHYHHHHLLVSMHQYNIYQVTNILYIATNSPPTSSFATVTSTPATSVDTTHHGSTPPTTIQDHHHHHHQHESSSPSIRKKKHSTSKPSNGTTSKCVVADHVAAALELTRTNPQVPPAPAAGMYWSRAVTFSARSKDAPALRAHSSCVVQDHLYVFGGSDAKRCFNTLHVLDMGKIQ